MSVVGIIQARMTSTRLPGKVLMPVAGKPLLQWQVERLRHSKAITSLCLATSVNKEDDPICDLADCIGLSVYRGSELDVLDRMYNAACHFGARHIVRLTGDCPLVDVAVCDRLVDLYLRSGCAYANTSAQFAEGLDCEVMSFAALEDAWQNARMASEREHVTMYIRNSGVYECLQLENTQDDSKYRITVDEEADFEVVRYLFENLKQPVSDGFAAMRLLLDSAPDIFALNSSIIRNEGALKSLANDYVFGKE